MALKGEQFFAESDARAIERERPVYRTERGFVLPPGIIPWNEYQKTQTRPMWHAENTLQRRIRKSPSGNERFVLSDDPKDILAFEQVRAEFRQETQVVVRGIRQLLRSDRVDVVVNGPSEQGLSARQRNLPRVTLKLGPLYFTSTLRLDELDRMKPSPRVAECLMHFDMERKLQHVRWHTDVDQEVLGLAKSMGFGIFAEREALNEMYRQRNFEEMSAMFARHIVAGLRQKNGAK